MSICRYSLKSLLLLLTCAGSSNLFAQVVPIDQRLPGVAPYWAKQSYKKVRYEGYSFWVDAYDAAVRQANVSLCRNSVPSQFLLVRLPGVDTASIAWRTGSESGYDWRIFADYSVGDVVWADDAQSGGLRTGDVVISVRGIIPPAKRKMRIAPNLTLPKLDAGESEFEKLLSRRDPVDGGYYRYRDGLLSPIEAAKTYGVAPLACSGKGSVSFGGWGVSFSSMVNNATGIGKALIDDDPNRYYRGSGVPVFRRFTADVFSEEQLRWMIVDQFAVDLAEGMFGEVDRDRFDVALRQLESSTAIRLGHPVGTESFGKNWRARAAFISVFAGLRLGLTERDYVSFLDERDKVIGGGLNNARAAVRSEILRKWFAAASQNANRNRMTAEDILNSVKELGEKLP